MLYCDGRLFCYSDEFSEENGSLNYMLTAFFPEDIRVTDRETGEVYTAEISYTEEDDD